MADLASPLIGHARVTQLKSEMDWLLYFSDFCSQFVSNLTASLTGRKKLRLFVAGQRRDEAVRLGEGVLLKGLGYRR